MYSELSTYIDARIAEVNAGITGADNDLVKIDADINGAELPDNQNNNRYILKIDNYQANQSEDRDYNVNLIIEFKFQIANYDATKYQVIMDNYIYALIKNILTTNYYDGTIEPFHFEAYVVGLKNGNQFDSAKEIFSPEVTIEGLVVA